MKTKITITIIAVLNVLQGIGFVLGGELLTKQSFPKDMLTEESIQVGSAMHWPLGVAFIVTGIILLSIRGLQLLEAKKVLLYTGFAYVFFLFSLSAVHCQLRIGLTEGNCLPLQSFGWKTQQRVS